MDQVGRLAIVLGGHWLLIEVFFGGRLVEPRSVPRHSPEPLLWIPITPNIPPEQPERVEKTDHRPRAAIARGVAAEPRAAAAAVPMRPSEPGAVRVPDWNLEAQSVAQSMAPRLINELQHRCATAERLAQAPPVGCSKDSFEKHWQPEPKRAGLVGIFPYVRLGRCIIGLGFWGCAVQEPSPDGTLLEDIRNPDRPASSVPDLPVQTFPQPPLPQAFK